MKISASRFPSASAFLVLSILFVLHLTGCAGKIPHTLIPAYDQKGIHLIAVLPVEDKTNHPEVGKMLRQEIVEALYFKQYPKIPLPIIDEKLSIFFPKVSSPNPQTMPPKDAGGLLGVHAVMYISVDECTARPVLFYARSALSARFHLYDARTGELIWSTQYRATGGEFNIVPDWLKMDAVALYGEVIEEVVKKVMETLPDGPGL